MRNGDQHAMGISVYFDAIADFSLPLSQATGVDVREEFVIKGV
jgi:hypothetical protein